MWNEKNVKSVVKEEQYGCRKADGNGTRHAAALCLW